MRGLLEPDNELSSSAVRGMPRSSGRSRLSGRLTIADYEAVEQTVITQLHADIRMKLVGNGSVEEKDEHSGGTTVT